MLLMMIRKQDRLVQSHILIYHVHVLSVFLCAPCHDFYPLILLIHDLSHALNDDRADAVAADGDDDAADAVDGDENEEEEDVDDDDENLCHTADLAFCLFHHHVFSECPQSAGQEKLQNIKMNKMLENYKKQ